jgi:hypothetical protein
LTDLRYSLTGAHDTRAHVASIDNNNNNNNNGDDDEDDDEDVVAAAVVVGDGIERATRVDNASPARGARSANMARIADEDDHAAVSSLVLITNYCDHIFF